MIPEGDPGEFTRVLYGCEADEVSEIVLMTPINDWWKALRFRADRVKEFKGFNRGFRGELGGKGVTVLDSRIGSPLALDCTYYLRFTPCRKIVFNGLIGALQPEIKIGDIIVPTAALRGEGASRYFVDKAYPAVADFGLLRALSTVLNNVYSDTGIEVHYGPIYTTDAFAAETPAFLDEWRKRNLLGIEMETSVIYTVAALYGMRAISFHVVSDNPVTKKSLFDPPTEEERARRLSSTDLLYEALERLVARI